MAAGLLLEHLDAPGIARGNIGADRDRCGVKAGNGLHIGHRNLARGGSNDSGDVLGATRHRRAAAEHRLRGAPRRQTVDLGADDAFQKIRGARRQFERTKQEAPGLENDLDPAPPEQGR